MPIAKIENKLCKTHRDPDLGLQLRKGFKTKLVQRLKKPSRRVSHKEVSKRVA